MPEASIPKLCSIEGCHRKRKSKGWCEMHYYRWRRHGDPIFTLVNSQYMLAKDRITAGIEIVTESGCWFWMMSLNNKGYGRIRINDTLQYAHRASYVAFNGEISEDMNVLHKCDTPCCVNPNHLFLGTFQDNVDDCINKGRFKRGEACSYAKLTEAEVIIIKNRIAIKHTMQSIANDYNVSKSCIQSIKSGDNWKHLPA